MFADFVVSANIFVAFDDRTRQARMFNRLSTRGWLLLGSLAYGLDFHEQYCYRIVPVQAQQPVPHLLESSVLCSK
jgi:hypothetical protein